MNEGDFQRWVIDVARRCGWKVWHVPAPMRWSPKRKKFVGAKEAAGLPDLILIHEDPPRLVFAELKGDSKLSDSQIAFLGAVRKVSVASVIARVTDAGEATFSPSEHPIAAYVWRPGMEEEVEAVLKTRMLR